MLDQKCSGIPQKSISALTNFSRSNPVLATNFILSVNYLGNYVIYWLGPDVERMNKAFDFLKRRQRHTESRNRYRRAWVEGGEEKRSRAKVNSNYSITHCHMRRWLRNTLKRMYVNSPEGEKCHKNEKILSAIRQGIEMQCIVMGGDDECACKMIKFS